MSLEKNIQQAIDPEGSIFLSSFITISGLSCSIQVENADPLYIKSRSVSACELTLTKHTGNVCNIRFLKATSV